MLKKDITELTRISLADYRLLPKLPVCLIADNIRSAHNIGALLRTADAFGIAALHLCGITPLPPHPDIHKTALGAENSVEWHHWPTTLEAIDALRADGWTICALEQAHTSIPLQLDSPEAGQKIAVIAGNEVDGVSEEALQRADHILEIPQKGTKHSLNVSVSASIALYQLAVISPLIHKN